MNVSTPFNLTKWRIARASIALGAIVAVALFTSSPPTSAATAMAKSQYADIGTGATRLVVQVNRGFNAKTDRHSTYATTNAATIRVVIDHVNALPKAPSLEMMCPMDVGAELTLSFYRHAAKPYAVVVADPGGCGRVSVRDYNASGTLTGSARVGGGAEFSAYVATRLHIPSLQTI